MTIAIIGAGINGLYLAWKLSEKGHKVTVFEKKEKIGKEACSGFFSDRILNFIPQSQKLIQNQIQSVLIHFPKRTLEIQFSKRFFVMSHFELDNLVANLAKDRGAEIILNYTVDSIPEGFDRVIGCDGPNSIVRRSLRLLKPTYRLAIQGFIKKSDSSSFFETWPVTPAPLFDWKSGGGFIWRIPRGNKTEYGIIGRPKEVKEIFNEFLKKNNLSFEKINSAIIPQGLIVPSNQKITLCGDAAGLTKPWSGGGVIWGLLAANLLLKNFPDFLKYKKAMKKFFLPKIIFSKIVTKMAYFLGFNFPWILPKNVKIEGDFLI